jgi:hypothetical protein
VQPPLFVLDGVFVQSPLWEWRKAKRKLSTAH